ncbi:Transmembrane emp24 domain-containing protein [Giardia muris]|uniref:Transmembrane emp24 domain-containing protein n=1 Tax=Giardia muris TaxID=5742 RepID=A0A4Z1SSC5_GIAMU|nr:Transmembrane emp24 domain-containing protein [Giardia muris]|eukprot:TNJ28670.1 Transmembrane emp24 domain-containing protein [Giardia muris]
MLQTLLTIGILPSILGVETPLRQGTRLCFEEELPEGVRFHGTYGATSPMDYPVNVVIESPAGLLYSASDIPEQARFAFTVTTSGTHRVCFDGGIIDDPSKSRNVTLQLDVGMIQTATQKGSTEDRIALAEQIFDNVREVQKDFSYMKEREGALSHSITRLGLAVIIVSIICITICWTSLVVTGQWVRATVKHRM